LNVYANNWKVVNPAHVSQHPQQQRRIGGPTDTDKPRIVEVTSELVPATDQRVGTTAHSGRTSPTILLDAETHDTDSDLDFVLSGGFGSDGTTFRNLLQTSRAEGLSPLILPILHSASNNLLSLEEASTLMRLILQGKNRGLLNALISVQSPATQAVVRTLLPSAIGSRDLDMIRCMLDTGIDPDSILTSAQDRPLEFAILTGSTAIIRLLLEYGAHVDLPCTWHQFPLTAAVGSGRFELVQLLLDAGANVNDPPANMSFGKTALEATINVGSSEILQLLLSHGAVVNNHPVHDAPRDTALQSAVQEGNIKLVQLLLSHGADVNAHATRGSALERAARAGNVELIDVLLTHGASDIFAAIEVASVNRHDAVVQTLLGFGSSRDILSDKAYRKIVLRSAVQRGDHRLAKSLLEYGANIAGPVIEDDATMMDLIEEAASIGSLDLVQLLMEFGADINAPLVGRNGRTPLQVAVCGGHVELVRFLLKAGADLHTPAATRGFNALEAAVGLHRLKMAQLSLDTGINIVENGEAALTTAVGSPNSLHMVRLLLDHWKFSSVAGIEGKIEYPQLSAYSIADPEVMRLLLEYGALDKRSALYEAVSKADLEVVRQLLHAGVETSDERTSAKPPALELAARQDKLEIMQVILEHGASVWETSCALQGAAALGRTEAARLLISSGADVNAARMLDDERTARTALQAAAEGAHLALVRLLLDEGAEVERESVSKYERGTALQFAAIAGSVSVVNELIQRGADVNAPPIGKLGRTALEGAAEHGRLDMVQLLINLEAEAQGSRAVGFARREGHTGVVTLLLENGFEDRTVEGFTARSGREDVFALLLAR
jgi:ankyrin repeat protein